MVYKRHDVDLPEGLARKVAAMIPELRRQMPNQSAEFIRAYATIAAPFGPPSTGARAASDPAPEGE